MQLVRRPEGMEDTQARRQAHIIRNLLTTIDKVTTEKLLLNTHTSFLDNFVMNHKVSVGRPTIIYCFKLRRNNLIIC